MKEPEEITETLQAIEPMVKDAIKAKQITQVVAYAMHLMKISPELDPSEVFFEALTENVGV